MAYAHSRNAQGERHILSAHLFAVAEQCAEFSAPFGGQEIGRWLGLWHDLGKLDPAFQTYLLESEAGRRPRTGPDHKAAGALLASRVLGPLALPLQGHHGGLTSPAELKAWLAGHTAAADAALEIARSNGFELAPAAGLHVPDRVGKDPLSAELFVRMLYSALVDADYLDTERHFGGGAAAARGRPVDMAALWRRFEVDQSVLTARGNGLVDQVRNAVYEACLAAADGPPGIYRLRVPTGGGKTRSALAFALRHALKHGMERIIVAVPFLSITEQTAGVYRTILGEGAVLEHHSQADELVEDERARLAAENWDAGVIVTTTVQLFESLFASRPQRARKVHRLARSVIILDEVQALPVHLLDPILDALKHLTADCGASVVFSTATQPAFDLLPVFSDPAIRDIVPDAGQHYALLRRVSYDLRGVMSWQQVASQMADCRQAMAVVNTKGDAMALMDALEERGCAPLHLSTQLCGAHRRAVIEEIRRRLAEGEACLLVSTQVIEAGVDIDFPVVYRAMAPLDSIIQAAGRCNREGRLAEGRVVVFEPADGHLPPGFYRTATGEARTVLAEGIDLDSPDGARSYYARLYRDVDTDALGIQRLRLGFDYAEVAERFRLIADATIPVAVTGYVDGTAVRRMLDALARGEGDGRTLLRRLQPYLVNVYRDRLPEYLRRGLVREIMDGLCEWTGPYHAVRGVLPGAGDAAELVI